MFEKIKNKFFRRKIEHSLYTPRTEIEKESCPICQLVKHTGRGGEKTVKYSDGEKVKVEIINEKNVPGRGHYTFNICNDQQIGWTDAPIGYCPYCGGKLGEK